MIPHRMPSLGVFLPRLRAAYKVALFLRRRDTLLNAAWRRVQVLLVAITPMFSRVRATPERDQTLARLALNRLGSRAWEYAHAADGH
jgi:hypothetical protein